MSPSRQLLLVYLLAHLLAGLALAHSRLPLPWTAIAITLLSMHCLLAIRKAAFFGARTIQALVFDGNEHSLVLRNGHSVPVEAKRVYCTAWLQAMVFVRQGRQGPWRQSFNLLVLPDSADVAARRHLRVHLNTLTLRPPR